MHRLIVLLLFLNIAQAEVKVGELTYTVDSPLYSAVCSATKRIPLHISMVVQRENIQRPVPKFVKRDWFNTKLYTEFQLEDRDYRGAYVNGAQIQRGHLYPILWCSNTQYYNDVNCMAIIVPQFQRTNLLVAQLEDYIADLSLLHQTIYVHINIEPSDKMVRFANSDEDVNLPSFFVYTVTYDNITEKYTIPNIPNPIMNFKEYRNAD